MSGRGVTWSGVGLSGSARLGAGGHGTYQPKLGRLAALAGLGLMLSVSAPDSAPATKKTNAVLPGGNSKQPINIEALKLDYFDKEQKLIYTGNVVAIQGESKLKASVLTIFLTPKNPDGAASTASTNQVQRMLAAGPVTLLQRDQVGTGDSGVYEKSLNTVVLTGNVTLSQGPNVTKGDKLTYDLKTGQAVVTGNGPGRVKSMFIPGSNDASADDDTTTRHAKGKAATTSSPGSRGL